MNKYLRKKSFNEIFIKNILSRNEPQSYCYQKSYGFQNYVPKNFKKYIHFLTLTQGVNLIIFPHNCTSEKIRKSNLTCSIFIRFPYCSVITHFSWTVLHKINLQAFGKMFLMQSRIKLDYDNIICGSKTHALFPSIMNL